MHQQSLIIAGQVSVNGSPFTGSGLFKFAIVHGSPNSVTSVWSNDGTSTAGSEPNNHVAVQVDGGLYSFYLAIRQLVEWQLLIRLYFLPIMIWSCGYMVQRRTNGFQQLTPDRPLASVPYALSAERANILNGPFPPINWILTYRGGPKKNRHYFNSHTITNEDIVFLQKKVM